MACGVSRGTRRPGAVACRLRPLSLRSGAGRLRSTTVMTALRWSTGLHIRVSRGRWSQMLLLRLGRYHHSPGSGAQSGGSQLHRDSAAWNLTGWGLTSSQKLILGVERDMSLSSWSHWSTSKAPCSQSKVAGSLPVSLITGMEGGAARPESATIGRTGLISFMTGGAAARVTV